MRIFAGAVTALRRLVDLGLVALIVVVLFGLILGKLIPLMGRQTIVVGGGSMEPAIHVGSAIVIRPVAAESLAVGDVVSMQVGPQHTVFTHRIIAISQHPDGTWIRTQGDANPAADPTMVPTTAVMGRVDVVIPLAGYLLALLSLPLGVMFVLGLAAALLAMAWLLETLELDRPSGAADEAHGSRRTSLEGHAGSPTATAPALGRLDDFLRGEPIAARPAAADSARGRAGSERLHHSAEPRRTVRPEATRPAFSAQPTALASTAGPGSRAWRDSGRRSPVRTQLERSREVRARRASWLRGGRGPID